MRKLLVALVIALCSISAFAEEVVTPTAADGPSAQSVSSGFDGTRFNLLYIQDGQSAKPGLSMERELPYNVRFHWATVYDTSDDAVATGPMFGYPVIKSKYIDVEALVGVMQNLGDGNGKTQFVYGGSVSVDMLEVFDPEQVSSTRPSAQFFGPKPRRSLNGLGLLATYTEDDGVGGGLGWTWEVADGIGLTPGVVLNHPDGAFNVSLAAGASVRLWGDAHSSVAGWGGWQYSFEGYGRPAMGVLFGTDF